MYTGRGLDTLGIWPAKTVVTIRQAMYYLRAIPRYLPAVGSLIKPASTKRLVEAG
jgi:hypothetical protein